MFSFFRSLFYKSTIFISLILVLHIPSTDADLVDSLKLYSNKWQASTLDISQQDPATGHHQVRLFDISQFQASGMAVASFRLRNQGQASPVYSFVYRYLQGQLCPELDLQLITANNFVYQGPLEKLKLEKLKLPAGQNQTDWIAIISHPHDSFRSENISCEFNIEIDTQSQSSLHFTDREVFTSAITTR